MSEKRLPNLELNTLTGETLKLEATRGRVLLLVNTASRCGLTGQYEGLQALQDKYGSQGLQVLGFPCNDFMGQEPGSSSEILQFCSNTYQVSFPLSEKLHVKGDGQHPLYQYLTAEGPESLRGEIKWNFTKFLIDRTGRPVARFEPRVEAQDEELIQVLEKLLQNE